MYKYFTEKHILFGYNEIIKSCNFNINNQILFKSNSEIDSLIKNYTINNLKNNLAFWNNYWIPSTDIIILHGNENDYDWMLSELESLSMSDGLKNRIIDKYSNGGGGGIAKNNTPVFWQLIGSSNTYTDLQSVGMSKLAGHLYSHIAQPGFLNNKSTEYIKYTDMPCWFIEGQSDYHSVALLETNFISNRKTFITNAYVPDGYRSKIKSMSSNEWLEIIYKDGNFEGPPVTYEYWSGFLMYEYLIINFGLSKIMELMENFVLTKNFRKSMLDCLGINFEKFYLEMAEMLVYYSQMIEG